MIGLSITGDKRLAKALHKLAPAVFNRVVRTVNHKLMKPVVAGARARVPVRFGLLKKSLGIKTKVYPRKGVVFTVVGARVGFHASVGTEVRRKAGRGAGGKFETRGATKTTRVVAPTKYAHLVEFGHKGPHAAPAHPFIRPAWDGERMAMLPKYKLALWLGIQREAARVRR